MIEGVEEKNWNKMVEKEEMGIGERRKGDMEEIEGIKLKIVDDSEERNRDKRNRVERIKIEGVKGKKMIEERKEMRRKDIWELKISVENERNKRGEVRIVLKKLKSKEKVEIEKIEVDEEVRKIVKKKMEEEGDKKGVVKEKIIGKELGKGIERIEIVELREVKDEKMKMEWSDRIKMIEWNCILINGI